MKEQYKRTLKKRIFISLSICVFLLIIIIPLNFLSIGYSESFDEHILDFLRGLQVGILTGLVIATLVLIYNYIKVMGNEIKLDKMYISEKDEMRTMIANKSASLNYLVTKVGLGIGILIFAFFDFKICITLILVLLFVEISYLIICSYYNRKYNS